MLIGTAPRRPNVLQDQNKAMKSPAPTGRNVVGDSLKAIKELGYRIVEAIEGQEFDDFGRMLHEHWEHKRRMSNKISKAEWDSLYEHVRTEYSVLGGKIIGAGGGGS